MNYQLALYSTLWRAVDLLYPPRCAGCDASGSRWCHKCNDNTQRMTTNICEQCGDLVSPANRLCQRCLEGNRQFEKLRSWGLYQGALRKAIHRFKFDGDQSLAETFSHPMVDMLARQTWSIELITAAPLHRHNRHRRGFNQAGSLAYALSLLANLPYERDALNWKKEVISQVGLTREEREANVDHAIEAKTSSVNEKIILVVDDITTTGATIDECARACRQAGAVKVYGLTLARAVYSREPEREENR